jgi:hypothetical protein
MAADNDWLKEGFAGIWPVHTEAFVRLMLVLRRDFGGDLDQMLILAVIGERALARRACPSEPSFEDLGRTAIRDMASVGINTHSLADYTGIPRETVRRKVAALVARGWVQRDASGDLRPTERAAADLAESTDATLDYLRSVAAAFDAARAVPAPPTSARRGAGR